MRSNMRIATLIQTSLVMGVLTLGMMTAPALAQTSQVDNPDWPLRSSLIHWPAGHTRVGQAFELGGAPFGG